MMKRRCDFGVGLARCGACGGSPILNRGCGDCGTRLCSKCAKAHLCGVKSSCVRSGKNIGPPRRIATPARCEMIGRSCGLTEVRDSYTIGRVLGQGAFGIVFACGPKNQIMQTQALKVIDTRMTPRADIDVEVATMRRFDHENVAKLYEVFNDGGCVCLLMDRYRGDLIHGINLHWETKGPIAPGAVTHVMRQMIAGIQHMHTFNVIHRDVKCDNFLMTHQDITDPKNKVVLSDFGASRMLSSPAERVTTWCGTAQYWAPEVYDKNYALKVDIWALGVVMYSMLAKTFPFSDEISVRKKQVRLARFGAKVADLMRNCLEKEEGKRFSATEASAHPWLRQKGGHAMAGSSADAGGGTTTTLAYASKSHETRERINSASNDNTVNVDASLNKPAEHPILSTSYPRILTSYLNRLICDRKYLMAWV